MTRDECLNRLKELEDLMITQHNCAFVQEIEMAYRALVQVEDIEALIDLQSIDSDDILEMIRRLIK